MTAAILEEVTSDQMMVQRRYFQKSQNVYKLNFLKMGVSTTSVSDL